MLEKLSLVALLICSAPDSAVRDRPRELPNCARSKSDRSAIRLKPLPIDFAEYVSCSALLVNPMVAPWIASEDPSSLSFPTRSVIRNWLKVNAPDFPELP